MSSIIQMDVAKNRGTPKSSILIGISIIFTIHFGVPLFLETPKYSESLDLSFFFGPRKNIWANRVENIYQRKCPEIPKRPKW